MSKRGYFGSYRFWVLMWTVFFALIAFLLIISLLSQRQTDSNEGPKIMQIKSMTCESSGFFYPFFKFDESAKKNFRVIVTFDEELLRAISLSQTLYYNDQKLIKQSEGENHAAMNISFGESGLGADALGANYAELDDAMRFGLYGTGDEIKNSAEFFLLDGIENYDFSGIKQVYEKLGLNCVDNDTKKE